MLSRFRMLSLVVIFACGDHRGDGDQLRVGLHVPREYYPQTPISWELVVLSAGRKAGCALKWWVASDNRQNRICKGRFLTVAQTFYLFECESSCSLWTLCSSGL